MAFIDRVDAGRRLGRRLHFLRDEDVVVLGLPRGGVPVTFEVARDRPAAGRRPEVPGYKRTAPRPGGGSRDCLRIRPGTVGWDERREER
jgi:hypothetical protein